MSINKFGSSLGAQDNSYYQWTGLIRNYTRDNALCLTSSGFDARSRKIRGVALPEGDYDAANKRYVEMKIKLLTERLDEFEKKFIALEDTLRITMNDTSKTIQYVTDAVADTTQEDL